MASYYVDPNIEKKAKVGPPAPTNTLGTQNKPNSLSASATQAAAPGTQSRSVPNTATAPTGTWTRGALQGAGFDNSQIGWNEGTGMATIDGKDYIKADSVADGKSYASDAAINQGIMNYYADNGNPLVSAAEYANRLGVSNAVQWQGDGMISVGGQMVKPTVITSEGKALMPTDQLEQLLSDYRDRTGVKSNQAVYDSHMDKYGGKIENALNKILDREEWSYNPEHDAAYQAYKEMYAREGNRALQDAVGNMSSMTGGYTSSAAATAGLQAQNYYMQQLNDRIPELMANSYNRYMGEQQLRQQALHSLLDVSNDDYNKLYQSNRDTINDINDANDKAYNRSVTERQLADNRTAAQDAHNLSIEQLAAMKLQNQYLPQQLANAQQRDDITTKYHEDNTIAALAGQQLSNNAQEQAIREAAWNMAYNTSRLQGTITPELGAALGLVPNEDGSYVSPWNTEIGYWNAVQKPQYDYQTQTELANQKDLIAYQAATNAKYAKSGRSSGSKSSSKSNSREMKIVGDDVASKWLWSPSGINGEGYFHSDYSSNTVPQYAAMDKLSSQEGIAHITDILRDSGYTASEIKTWIKNAKDTAATEVAKIEGQDYYDTDIINEWKRKYNL